MALQDGMFCLLSFQNIAKGGAAQDFATETGELASIDGASGPHILDCCIQRGG